jgi:DNA-binding NarL/FixJ family response regulator
MKPARELQLLVAGPFVPETRKLHKFLTQQRSVVVVAETLEISRVPELARTWRPDVVMIHTPTTDFAVEAVHSILTELPQAKLLVVASSLNFDDARLILEHGARGILEVGTAYAQGMRAVRAVEAGEIWASRALMSRIVEGTIKHTMQVHAITRSSTNLTEREAEIVKMLRTGSSNKEIASGLSISEKTVKAHLHNIYGKLRIHRRQKLLPALLS